ncbi:DUF4011 domain-containing protein [Alteribacillus sp. JSM 102045]|uniref:DUF4011 domain-containing protein n=1 Tax=Alteribacillus sp. JSM 102045 TaxID=1562101 RepID=UPI0035C0B535
MNDQRLDKKIEQWKSRLLDLTKRNRLLNFKSTNSTLKLDEDTDVVFRQLYNNDYIRVNTLVELNEEAKKITQLKIKKSREDISEEEINKIEDNNLARVYQKLEKQLNNIRLNAKSSIDEKGVNTLYLACGFLNWTEVDHSNVVLKSPILLLPVSLSRETARDPYYINRLDDELILNPVLEQKMKADFGIELTPIEELAVDLDNYSEIISHYNQELNIEDNWEINDESYIGLFSFSKLVMYKDFEQYEEIVRENQFVQQLAGIEQEKDICLRENIPDIKECDRELKSEESFQILDADSSQQEAIFAAKNGVSFVMQGPPGTGKSQTITNIIAELLAQEKKVLFVSEKRAALEVVKKKLDEQGLSDYSLDLHNHSSNKKAVLEELKKSFNQQPSPFYLSHSYSEFDQIKQDLNYYVDELHHKISPLEKTAYEIHGELAKLDDIPEVLFDLDNINSYTQEKLKVTTKKIRRLQKQKKKIGDSKNHLWRGTILTETGYEFESKITAMFSQLADKLHQLNHQLIRTCEFIGYDHDLSLAGVDHLIDIGQKIENKPVLPTHWFNKKEKESLYNAKENIENYKEIFNTYFKIQNSILKDYDQGILEEDLNNIKNTCTEKHKNTLADFTNDFEQSFNLLLDFESELLHSLNSLKDNFEKTTNDLSELESLLNTNFNGITKENVKELFNVYEGIKDIPRPTGSWFNSDNNNKLRKEIEENKKLFNEYSTLKSKIDEKYQIEIIDEDLEALLNRYQNDYSSFLRILKSSYRNDNRFIKSFQKEKQKSSYYDTIQDLRLLMRAQKMRKQIDDKKDDLENLFGFWYKGVDTDWDTLRTNLESILSLSLYLDKINKKEIFQPFIIRLEEQSLKNFYQIINDLSNNYDNIIQDLTFVRNNFLPNINQIDRTDNILKIGPDINQILKTTEEILNAKNTVTKYKKSNELMAYDSFDKLFDLVSQFNQQKQLINKMSKTFSLYYGKLYKGTETNWTDIKEALEWTLQMKKNFKDWFPESFINTIEDSSQINSFIDLCRELKSLRDDLEEELVFYEKIFQPNELKFNNKSIYHADLADISPQLDLLSKNTSKINEWVVYNESLQDVIKDGLSNFVNSVIERHDASFEKIFLKRFYRLWLDNAYSKLNSLKSFRLDQHHHKLEEFKSMDEEQINSNSARLHKMLTEQKENYINNIADKRSELGILNREIRKKKRHKPIRRLFSDITELLLSIKPCMMMSPLSVSQFVDPSKLAFDVVIFDEASQIRPEDAIGSIMRGKQIIIAGDNKQLPPTSFFSQQVDVDDEFIDEEDEDLYEIFESILDESLLFMPTISLKWHYRSKQESLIAFSNREIYDNNLYTFPNSISGTNDGISFVHVEDGIYDRGKSSKNIKEAERVALLVKKHIKRNPERSLGIIAFNQQQQEAIRDKVDEMILRMPEIEFYFNEDHFESFFIKNLENVQGDERDTIILSIGYGKDKNGSLYYNFGPLNKEGGERRLNVAVTRAKKEIIVASSLLDIDLDDAKLNRRGPKLLKSYLSYARNNGEFSQNEGIQNDGDFDSPFEQDVYNMLRDKGLELRKQVGCSGYRIDLAVVDPNQPGKYILGIECDGASYHSSKTARDRDRLRQSVLESLGWKIKRIWSQDWVKHKKEITEDIFTEVKGIVKT